VSEGRAWPAWFLSNHDFARVVSRYGGGDLGQARARAAAMLLYTLCGTPFIYQGEELGLPDAEIPPDRVVDVDGRDPVRAPIPWGPPSEAGPAAGFSTGKPWLPTHQDAETLNVARQLDDPASMLSLVRRLAWFRARDPCFTAGGHRSIDAGGGIFGFMRETKDAAILVLINFESESCRVGDHDVAASGWLELSTDPGRDLGRVDPREITLGPTEGILVRIR
jgi:alpha-glucosidase